MGNRIFHPCPICGTPVRHWERYPRAVCSPCEAKACDERGRRLAFYNVSAAGGFEAIVVGTREIYPSHRCYIDGVACWADEARFGGIVVQLHP